MLSSIQKIVGKARDKKQFLGGLAAGGAAVAAGPAVFARAFDAGHDLYSFGRRAVGLSNAYEDSQPNSEQSKHNRRILGYAQRRILKQIAEQGAE